MKCLILLALIFSVQTAIAAPQEVDLGDNCEICQTVVGAIESWVESNETVAAIEQYLNQLCTLVPDYTAVCQAIVQQEIPQIIDWIEQNESPKQVCVQLGLCSALKALMAPKPAAPKDSNCNTCEFIVSAVEGYLAQNKSVEEIEQELEAICAYIPGFTDQCNQIVEQYVPQIIEWIQQNETPETVCTQLGFCGNAKASGKENVKVVVPSSPLDECATCTLVVGAIENWLQANSSVAYVTEQLEQLCQLVPSFEQQCDALAEYGVQQAINWILENEDPKTLCSQIGACSSRLENFKPKSSKCGVCKYGFSVVSRWLNGETSPEAIDRTLKNFCTAFPRFQSICKAVEGSIRSRVIESLANGRASQEICTAIERCPVGAAKPAMKKLWMPSVCGDCVMVVRNMSAQIRNDVAVDTIKMNLAQSADAIEPIRPQVQAILQAGVGEVAQWLQGGASAKDLCQKFSFCQAPMKALIH